MSRRRPAAGAPRRQNNARGGEQWVTTLRPGDVLFGRGSGPNNREGNITFRRLVKERKEEYNATKNRQIKHNIALDIIATIRTTENGRFLRKATPKDMNRLGIPQNTEAWCMVDEKAILEKVKQALRQKAEWKDLEDHSTSGGDNSGTDQAQDERQVSSNPNVPPAVAAAAAPVAAAPPEEPEAVESMAWRAPERGGDHDEELLPDSEMLFGRELLDRQD